MDLFIVHRQRSRSTIQASLRSRGMALAATMADKNEHEVDDEDLLQQRSPSRSQNRHHVTIPMLFR
eukprot:1997820-Amphidinium_carterae.1